jgi:hypothetical protein
MVEKETHEGDVEEGGGNNCICLLLEIFGVIAPVIRGLECERR